VALDVVMDEPACPGCRRRDVLIAELQRQLRDLAAKVRDLEQRLGQNAGNSSLPPSANPPAAPKPVRKTPTGRRAGGQRGHAPFVRVRLPAERVAQVVHHRPTHCRRCLHPLPAEPGPHDPPPTWHQVAELPAIAAVVTEHQGHTRTCPHCGTRTHAPIPAAVRGHVAGPRLTAAITYLSGARHDSKRGAEEVVETLFGVPVALGTVAAAEQEVSAALADAHAEALAAVRAAPVKNVDETGWKRAGRLCWLWAGVTQAVACFQVHARRGLDGLRALLGDDPAGVVVSDRWCAYGRLDPAGRQLCWAHLKRDFRAMVDRGGPAGPIGHELLCFVEDLFLDWHRVRDGTIQRATLRRVIDGWRPAFRGVLERGVTCGCAKTAAVCRSLLAWEPALWTFTRVDGVEPTNNAAERAVRPAVLWRRRSFGSHSEAGCRFVERILTVVQTLRHQRRPAFAFLADAIAARRQGRPAPQLLPTG
jgi:transposase